MNVMLQGFSKPSLYVHAVLDFLSESKLGSDFVWKGVMVLEIHLDDKFYFLQEQLMNYVQLVWTTLSFSAILVLFVWHRLYLSHIHSHLNLQTEMPGAEIKSSKNDCWVNAVVEAWGGEGGGVKWNTFFFKNHWM